MKAEDGSSAHSEENDRTNYSFKQKSLVIPAFKNNMNSAVLQSSLVLGPSKISKLPPLKKPEKSIDDSTHNDDDSSVDYDHDNDITLTPNSASSSLIPHPPNVSRSTKNTRKKIESIKNVESFSNKVEIDSDIEKNAKCSDTESQQNKSDVEDIINKKLDEDNLLLNSYEDYLRKLTSKEEGAVGGSTDNSSDSESDSNSSSSFSISSLSGSEDEDSDKSSDADKNKSKTFEPLYSLPIKPKKNQNNALGAICTLDDRKLENSSEEFMSLINNSEKFKTNFETSKKSFYATMDQTLMDPSSLRTQSAPDLRNTRPRTLDTLGYMCPVRLPNLEGNQATFSSPELKNTTFNLKFRPLPSIPIDKKSDKTSSKKGRDDSIYETVRTRNFSESVDSPTKGNKISFKAVADRVVSLMPRLTTREARSREMDHYMADVIRYLPDKKLRIFVGTWNMKGIKVMPHSLDDYLLPSESVFIQDIYAVGCQEGTPFRKEWEICLQETLGPTHVLMYSGNFGVLQLSIFVRREIVWFCTNIEQDTVATRIAHKIKTKGAIAVSFNVFGTSLLFINSHFASDQQKLKERIVDYRAICRSLSIPLGYESDSSKPPDVTSRFDRVFWFGDFNFRVNKKRSETDGVLEETGFESEFKRTEYIVKELFPHDQLHHLLKKGKIFQGFNESEIEFLPTYKFDVNTDTYDTSAKKRVPSWTDRILYKSRQPDQIKVSMYNSCTTIKCSDHRPVFAILEANIEPVKKNVLLPCAMFDREIYVEANMRRSAPKGSQQSSNVCAIL